MKMLSVSRKDNGNMLVRAELTPKEYNSMVAKQDAENKTLKEVKEKKPSRFFELVTEPDGSSYELPLWKG